MNDLDHESVRLFGVLVTFRRPAELADSLRAIVGQTHKLERLLVVDNAPSDEARRLVEAAPVRAEYIAASTNLGPAGGVALGMERLLDTASDRDWIVTLDDDDPPLDPATFATLCEFAVALSRRDPSTAAVGLSGMRFDRRRGRLVRVPDDELHDAVPVDSIGGNQCPCYSVASLREVGVFRADLFFGFEELEFGLRLRDRGFSLFGHGALWHARRQAKGLLGRTLVPSRAVDGVSWRRYYSVRNLIVILRSHGATASALRVTAVVGLGKPLVNVPRRPRIGLTALRLGVRASFDAWSGRMGRAVEPT